MALVKQKVAIPLGVGVDTKTDQKLLSPAKFTVLENAVFDRTGGLNKRKGYNVLPKTINSSSEIQKGSALGSFNNEINLYTGQELYTYASASSRWIKKGDIVSLVADTNSIVVNASEQLNPSVASNNGFVCYAYEVGNAVKYTVVDQNTGTNIVNDVSLGADRSKPKVVSLGNNYLIILVFNSSSNIIEYFAITINDPATIFASGTISGSINTTDTNYDAVSAGDFIYVTYNSTSDETEMVRFAKSLTVDLVSTIDLDAASECITITRDESSRLWIAARDGTDLRVTVVSPTLVQILAPTPISTTVANPINVTMSVIGDTGYVFYEYSDADTIKHFIRQQTVTVAGTTGTESVLVRSVGLSAKSFIQDGVIYIPTIHESPLQSTNFIINTNAQVVARLSYQTAGKVGAKTLSDVARLSNNRLLLASSFKRRLSSEAGNLFSTLSVQSTVLDFSNESRFQNTELSNLFISGACPQIYDGVNVVEEGFNLYPEKVTAAEATVTGGAVANGTYQVSVCYEWTDNLGNIFRSAPSVPVSVTTTGGNNAIAVTIPTLRLTQKKDVRLVVYRTEDAGSIFYRATTLADIGSNDKTVDSIIVNSVISDATLVGNDQLYTTGGVLENFPIPACSLIANYKNRVIVAGLEDKLQIGYTKARLPGEGVEFTDFFRLQLDAFGGDATALGVLDNYVVFFKRNSIFVLTGEGPNELGQQNDFRDPQLITTDVGCDNPNSVVITPIGLMFKSTKGIYLLGRNLQVTYIGADVEAFNGKLITSSQLLSDVNQVRFITNDETCLVYDYFQQQWSTFTNHTSEDCIVFENKFTFLRANGEVWQENNEFSDNSNPIKMRLVTSWLSLGDLQGYKRIYKMLFLGEYKGPHKIRVSVAQDFNEVFTQQAIIDPEQIFGQTAYGDDATYGSGSPYGGEDTVYQFEVKLSNQKCQSVKFMLQDFPDDVSEGLSLSAMTFEVGVKQGLNPVRGQRVNALSRQK